MAISQGIVVMAMLFSFRRQRLRKLVGPDGAGLASWLPPGRFSLSDFAFLAVAVFVVALWVELLVRGQIPLFAGIERFDYTRLYGGPLHRRLLEWGPMLAFQVGVFFAVPLLHSARPDRRFGALFASLLLYLFLAGHRFSALYAYSSFFVIPIGAVLIGRQAKSPFQNEIVSKGMLRYLAAAGLVLVVLIAGAVAYSYIVVRGEGAELMEKLTQRVLVQQGEMWWMTYDRVFLQDDWSGRFAAYKLFVDPFDPAPGSFINVEGTRPEFESIIDQYAFFAENRLAVTEQFSLIAGVRQDQPTVERTDGIPALIASVKNGANIRFCREESAL
jgi:hypothetical protein